MTNKNLFKEAIADAKTVRQTILANAKSALEEAITPKLQSMLSAKLQEMDNNEDLDENVDEEVNENYNEDELEEDFDLSSILAELDDEEVNENYDDEIDEAEEKSKPKPKPKTDSKPKPKSEPSSKPKSDYSPKEPEEEKISDLTVDEFTSMIRDIVSQAVGGGAGLGGDEMGGDEFGGDEMGGDDLGGEDEFGGMGDEQGMGHEPDTEEDDFNLDELLAELDNINEEEDELDEVKIQKWPAGKKAVATTSKLGYKPAPKGRMNERKELSQAIKTINVLRGELKEQSLFSAKMLYINKFLKNKNLSESQIAKAFVLFDKTKTSSEAKMVFESLQTNISKNSKKQTIRENLGSASRALGMAPRRAIVESNDVISRMQKLANIL